MSISIRESIRWLPDAASEPTSTVVLTSPEHRFVDIRILKEEDSSGSATRLDWAFAGISSSEIRDGDVRHCTWRHVVDSRTRSAPEENVVDEGDIFPQDDGRTLETGRMVNPATGKLTDYEEVWADLEAEKVKVLGLARCVVLELKEPGDEQRGMVVCLGGYCQGVVRHGDKFTADRWLWEDGKWQRKYHVGDLCIPDPDHLHGIATSMGVKTRETTSRGWLVVEMSD
jgi:hypothetical protein